MSILLIFSKNLFLYSLIFLKVFFLCVSISFSSALILVISCLLLGFEFFLNLAPLALSILMIGYQFWISPCFSCGTYCYIFSSRDCFKCIPEILVCCVFVLIGFEELLYFCLHFIVYPVNTLKQVVQFPSVCAGLSVFLNPEF